MMPKENPERLEHLLARREEVIPLLQPTQLKQEGIPVFLDEQARRRQETVDRVRQFLLPYEATLHASMKDRWSHPEELLRTKFPMQFAVGNPESGELTFVSMAPQRLQGNQERGLKKLISKNKNAESGCDQAVFCHTSADRVSHFIDTGMYLNYLKDKGKATFVGLPDIYDYAIGFMFDKAGKIQDISYTGLVDSEAGMEVSGRSNLITYRLFENDFTVIKKSGFISYSERELPYTSDKDGKLSSRSITKDVTIEDEIGLLMKKLPFEPHKVGK